MPDDTAKDQKGMKEQLKVLRELRNIDRSMSSLVEAFEELKNAGELTDEDIDFILREFEDFATGKDKKMEDIRNDLRSLYKRYYSKFSDRAIVPVKNGVCTGCYVTIPPMRIDRIHTMDSLEICENCGRILIWEEGSEQ
jgi:predicted  nucleic acid-binding Zn-ribbon protein